jgi:hypothetical protein
MSYLEYSISCLRAFWRAMRREDRYALFGGFAAGYVVSQLLRTCRFMVNYRPIFHQTISADGTEVLPKEEEE